MYRGDTAPCSLSRLCCILGCKDASRSQSLTGLNRWTWLISCLIPFMNAGSQTEGGGWLWDLTQVDPEFGGNITYWLLVHSVIFQLLSRGLSHVHTGSGAATHGTARCDLRHRVRNDEAKTTQHASLPTKSRRGWFLRRMPLSAACLEDKRVDNQNCSVMCCVRQLCTMVRTHVLLVLTFLHVLIIIIIIIMSVY